MEITRVRESNNVIIICRGKSEKEKVGKHKVERKIKRSLIIHGECKKEKLIEFFSSGA